MKKTVRGNKTPKKNMSNNIHSLDSGAYQRAGDRLMERGKLLLQSGRAYQARECFSRAEFFFTQSFRAKTRETLGRFSQGECVCCESGEAFRVTDPSPGSDVRCQSTGLDMPSFLRNGGPVSISDVGRGQAQ